ncbi:MAG TPA: hypothetical protein VH165_18885 [Kofleriaceae bacterium]|nr:hypothetical protein [Kofleriaceae bacterium]
MEWTRTDRFRALARVALVGLVGIGVIGCGDPPPGRTFFERNIEPILAQKCAGNTSGCHSTNADDPFQFAAGNLDVSSFEGVQKRRDVLAPFGAYSYPLLLIKAVPTGALTLSYNNQLADTFPPLQVQHSGGAILDVNSDAFFTLQNWLNNGATENGLPPATPPQTGSGSCSHTVPAEFDQTVFITPATQASFDLFKSSVQPILTQHGCNAGSCHGAPQSDFYITCGMSDAELAFNFSQAWSFVNTPVEDSQILKIPLAVNAGGRGHTGGDQFASQTDKDYLALRAWAMQAGRLDFAKGDMGRQFFAQNIQPLLLLRGCSFEACHSPAATNDLKLRTGTQGFFSAVALEKNYDLLKNQFMALEFPDARRGRAMSKTLLNGGPAGMSHRGGPVLELAGSTADPTACAQPFVAATASPFCTFQEWVRIERLALGTQVAAMAKDDTIPVVYVERPTGSATDRLNFDTFKGGAKLMKATATFGDGQVLTPMAEGTVLSDKCGFGADVDIQAPDVANDGTRVVFAARDGAADSLGLYVVDVNDTACQRLWPKLPDSNGLKVHDFDPAFSPDGKFIVFASTRGKPANGATKSRKRFLPQSDLWRVAINGTTADTTSYQQITVLSNSEVGPQFMREGRITMTTEKTSDGFYQLSGRRINWDLTDYHPLLAQRAVSPYADLTDLTMTKPSIGYAAATDIREGSDGNFLLILSDVDTTGAPVSASGGGALGVFNRSIGPFEQGRTDTGFVSALRLLDGANANGRMGGAAAYRAPVSLPDGQIMVSYAASASQGNFDLVTISPHGAENRAPLFTAAPPAGQIRVDAVLAYPYPARPLYDNRRQLVFGGSADGDPAHGVIHMPDAPLLFTLLTGNLRRGRPVDAFRGAKFIAAYSEGLCTTSCTAGSNGIFENRQMLGSAPLADDGSVRFQLPAQTGVVLELQDDKHNTIIKMGEEHQLGPGEQISMGVSESLFNVVCAGCHGSVSGHEVDVGVSPDALTGASSSKSATATPATIGP